MAPDRSTLYRLYHEKRYSYRRIAQAYGVCKTTVGEWMAQHDLQARDAGEAGGGWPGQGRVERATFTQADGKGYERVGVLDPQEGRQSAYVHRLVAVAHHGLEAVEGQHVHHQNGIPWDNRAENLEVLTPGDHAALHRKAESRG